MSAPEERYRDALEAAARHARRWLESQETRRVGPQVTAADLAADFGGPLPRTGMPAAEVVDYLAAKAEPGLMAMPSGRFFGWVIGGTLPAALAADWLVSAWDQNAGLRFATPATAAIEEAAGKWLLELLGLPEESDVGFATGATMANFTGLAAARWRLMADAGWDLDGDGLAGAPRIRCFVGQERHDTIDLGLRYLGLGRPTVVPADRQGRIIPGELDRALDLALSTGEGGRPAPLLVCLQAGNLHSGAFDPFVEAIAVAKAHGAWVHVDGAFGLWAAAVPELAALTAGTAAGRFVGHRRAQDPQRALRLRDRDRARRPGAALGHGPAHQLPDPGRGRGGGPVRDGAGTLPPGPRRAGVGGAEIPGPGRRRRPGPRARAPGRQLAEQLAALDGVEVLNDVDYTQVSLAFGDDATTRAVTETDHRRRPGLDVRVTLAGPRHPADLGEQLEHGRRRRAASPSTPSATPWRPCGADCGGCPVTRVRRCGPRSPCIQGTPLPRPPRRR